MFWRLQRKGGNLSNGNAPKDMQIKMVQGCGNYGLTNSRHLVSDNDIRSVSNECDNYLAENVGDDVQYGSNLGQIFIGTENKNEFVQIVDCSGKVVFSEVLEEKSNYVDLSYLAKGVYFIFANDECVKMIKN